MSAMSLLRTAWWGMLCALVLAVQPARAQTADTGIDPPDRVARLSYLDGDVSFAPAGSDDWGQVGVNRPVVQGDRLLSGDASRAALELGGAQLRLGQRSAFNFLALDDDVAQVELSSGTLNLRVSRLDAGQRYEIDTPTLALVVTRPGEYRVDIAPDGKGSMVTVFDGDATVYGEGGVDYPVQAGQSYRFDDPQLQQVDVAGVPDPDAFDRWCFDRDRRRGDSLSRRYVAADVVGADDLDDYGNWTEVREYGHVWFPSTVVADWAPYRYGHWTWIDPWGWTWVDDAPWGFAPFHYGRWVSVGGRWGWAPGPVYVRPVYAPALVAFVGGSGWNLSIGFGDGPVGWFPLGPRDVYVPPYRCGRRYFTNVNVTNVTVINKTVINNTYVNLQADRRNDYARSPNLHAPHAVTVVSRDTFVGARPVGSARVRDVNPADIARAPLARGPRLMPTEASLGVRGRTVGGSLPSRQVFERPVVARSAPPPAPPAFAERRAAIERNGGAPLDRAQLRQVRAQTPRAATPDGGRVVLARPGAPTPGNRGDRPRDDGMRGEARAPLAIRSPMQAPTPRGPRADDRAPRSGELPSARYAPRATGGDLPAQRRSFDAPARADDGGAERANRLREQALSRPPQRRDEAPMPRQETGGSDAPRSYRAPQEAVRETPRSEMPRADSYRAPRQDIEAQSPATRGPAPQPPRTATFREPPRADTFREPPRYAAPPPQAPREAAPQRGNAPAAQGNRSRGDDHGDRHDRGNLR